MLYDGVEDKVETPVQRETPPAPTILRVAVATRDGQRIDFHFGQAESFWIYAVSADGPRFVEERQIAEHALHEDEDKRETIYRMLADCSDLLIAKIGATPQEALAKVGVQASNMYAGKDVSSALAELYAAKLAAMADAAVDSSEFRLLHAMLRVADLDRSIDFYTRKLGMQLMERREHKKNMFSQAYLGYGGPGSGMTLELVANWMRDEPYVHGDAFGHIAVGVTNIMRLCDRLAVAGVPMPRPPRAQRHGESVVAFIEDPDGYRVELVQAPQPEADAALDDVSSTQV
ncbi:VOC family protein [Methylocystis heyeri]|uniref:Aldoketomutase n=1 Tax=Methylocystis heyeri TaxID=391905 RepID=A0A6B8K8E8_9HYPH|nr:VOC family protein [Methylocystis heyeri]QGM44276.1 lactoylglutathione lyase [Methylocystis heyeri]